MTGRRLSVTLGRPLGAALSLGGLLLVGIAAIGASWADLSAAVAEREAQADLLDRSIAAGRRAAPPPGAAAPSNPFVIAPTATLAAADVDAALRGLAVSSGLVLLSSRADAKPDEPGPSGDPVGLGTRIEDQAIVEGQNAALQAFLLALEDGSPVTLVDAVTVEPAEADQATPADPQAPRLRASLTVSAYWRASSKPPAPR